MMTTFARAWIDDAHAEWDREARTYGPDEDDDGDGETDETPLAPTEYDDDRRRGRNDAVRCPCPALEPYPPAGWLTLPQDDAREFLRETFAVEREDGTDIHLATTARRFWRAAVDAWMIPADMPVFEKVFSVGVVVSMDCEAFTA